MSYIIVRRNIGPKDEISYSYFNGDISATLWSYAFESNSDRAYKFEEGDDYDNARDCVSQMTKEGLDVFIEKISTAEQPKSAVLKMVNPNRYSSNFAKKVEIKIELMLDSVPGAWHQPEDFMKWVCQHNYVQTVELVEKIDMEPATVVDLKELLFFAFAAGLGKHPRDLTNDELSRYREFEPVPRSTFQRVEHAVKIQEERSKGNG